MKNSRKSFRATACAALAALAALAPPAVAATAAERPVSDTPGGVAPVTGGVVGVTGARGTGLPADAPAQGADPVPVGHQVDGVAAPSSVIGPDDRTRVDPTTAYPARATVLITRVVDGREAVHCTGWMFAADLVLTAGHCVYNQSAGWRTGELKFYPGADGADYPYGSCAAVSLYSNTGWTEARNPDSDYGAAKLDCTVGETTGYYGAYATTDPLLGTPTTVQGYPGDKAQQQWTHTDAVRAETRNRLYYANDTVGGSSGSAVYTVRPPDSLSCSGYCALAFHAYGAGSNGYNSGPRITAERLAVILSW